VCDEFLIVADGRAKPFDGDLDDYMAWVSARRLGEGAAKDSENVGQAKPEDKQTRATAHAARENRLARRRPLVKEREQLERARALAAEKLF
jgi:ATP-binding cassette subfamily F protein 3